MKPFSKRKADGSLRTRLPPDAATIAARKLVNAKKARSRRANGKMFNCDLRSAKGRRLAELCREFGAGLNLEDARTAGLVRSTAALAVEIERREGAAESVDMTDADALVFARLVNARSRSLEKLAQMRQARAQLQPEASSSSGLATLQQHLKRLAAQQA
jgi:hypothetical protein